jgi:hypothetical protein
MEEEKNTNQPAKKTVGRKKHQSIVWEFWGFIKHEKKWWMIPLIAILLLLMFLIIFAQTSPLAPFLYPFF